MVSQSSTNNTVQDNDFSVNKSTVGVTAKSSIVHSDNTSIISNSKFLSEVGGANGGDPYLECSVSGVRNYAFGLDNTDSDSLKVTTDTTSVTPSSGTELFKMTSSGERTMPFQPAFHAYLPSIDVGVTGGGANYTIGGTTALVERFDIGNNLVPSTGVFTAPVTGIYMFMLRAHVSSLAASNDSMVLFVTTSTINHTVGFLGNIDAIALPTNSAAVEGSVITQMSAGDSAIFVLSVLGGAAGSVDVVGDAGGQSTFIMGFLIS